MDPVTTRIPARPTTTPDETRLRAFKATDAFVVEAFRLTATFEGAAGRDLGREIREAAGRCGGALVAASVASAGDPSERRCLALARERLAEGRYYLYLARRLGLIDVARYRTLMTRHDAATRELDHAFRDAAVAGPRAREPA